MIAVQRRSTGAEAAAQPCEFCFKMRLRLFLTAAAALMIGMYLQPDWAVAVAGLMPSPLALSLALWGVGGLGFALRMAAHRREMAAARVAAARRA